MSVLRTIVVIVLSCGIVAFFVDHLRWRRCHEEELGRDEGARLADTGSRGTAGS